MEKHIKDHLQLSNKFIMNKIYFSLLITIFCSGIVYGQNYPLVTIQQIQQVPNDSILAGNDLSDYDGDTVRVRGVVVTPPGSAESGSTDGRWIWIQDGKGPWAGLNVRKGNGNPTIPSDMLFVVPGDSVEIAGVVNTFNNETQLDPLDSGFVVLGSSSVGFQSTDDISDFDNPNGLATTVEGEPWEGQFFELTNMTVVSVTATANDIRFRIADADGDEMEVYDTYTVMQPSTTNCTNCIPYPPFVPPSVGDVFDTLRGIIDGRNLTNPPYAIAPFDTTHFVYGAAAPKIFDITRTPQVPTPSQMVTVTATITDNGGSVTGARLFYALGESTTTYNQVNMTNVGSTYSADIPAGSDGQMVKYYLEADDNDANSTISPGGAPTSSVYFYFVKASGQLSIRDVQYTPFDNGVSGYLGETVTVGGVVSASAAGSDRSLGTLYIQDRTYNEWAGIWIAKGANLSTGEYTSMVIGDTVLITGIVEEEFQVTRIVLDNISDFTILGQTSPAQPMNVNPADFTSYSFAMEGYESMLLNFSSSIDTALYVVDDNSDDPDDYGEWRIGEDPADPNTGSRVLVGRDIGTKNFSLVTPNRLQPHTMSVPEIIVTPGHSIRELTGIMYYSFGNFKLLPRNNDDATDYNGQPLPSGLGLYSFEDQRMRIYPNPTSGQLSIETEGDIPNGSSYSIHDIMGREVASGNLQERIQTIDVSNIPSGQYLLVISNSESGSRINHRVIIQ